jgi:AcrR family transcriptional regulator
LADSNKKKIIAAFIDILKRNSYNSITLEKIARKAKVKKEIIMSEFIDVDSIALQYLNEVDIETLHLAREDSDRNNPKDIMFNIIINRLEIYDRDRSSILNLLDGKSNFRLKYISTLPRLIKIFDLLYGDKNNTSLKKLSRDLGFLYIYKRVLHAWITNKEISELMSLTDKKLIRAGEIYSYLNKPVTILDDLLCKCLKTKKN